MIGKKLVEFNQVNWDSIKLTLDQITKDFQDVAGRAGCAVEDLTICITENQNGIDPKRVRVVFYRKLRDGEPDTDEVALYLSLKEKYDGANAGASLMEGTSSFPPVMVR